MSTAPVKKLTWDDIKDWPECHGRTEIVDGELVMSPLPSIDHQEICLRLGDILRPFAQQRDLGEFFSIPVHVVLAEHVQYEPDLCFIAKQRLHIAPATTVQGPPDLIIEVISESTRTHDTVVKFRDYEQYDVQEYWLVDPRDEQIRVFSLESGKYVLLGTFGGGDTVVSRIFAGLVLDPAQVFRNL